MGKQMPPEDCSSLANIPKLITVIAFSLAVSLASQTASTQGRERSGKEVVDAVCAACHAPGVTRGPKIGEGAKYAPKIGDKKAWAPLASRGLASLTESALKGIRNMPAHGGNMRLTDVEIERAITYMVNQSGGRWTEPISGVTPSVERKGKQVVEAKCADCHQTGKDGAPRIGDRQAWIPRLKHGLDFLVRSAIHGHGSMPPRGGMADLTDSEIRGAIAYMLNPPSAPEKTAPPAALPKVPASRRRVAGGTEIYLGVVSAQTIRAQHPKADKESLMHGGIPRGKDYYHVNISLFDSKTRAAVSDAQVEASVREPVYGGENKKLELVTFNKMPSFGNYFRMSGKSTYTITVRIRRPGLTQPIEAKFQYKTS
ncbi:MAG: cytochrome c5 family protein [Betaproteobacteria bacterium]|nr:cytochrome c5 family protein [Betaproteobacteria bacterium]